MLRRATDADAEAVADVFIASFRGLGFLPELHSEGQTRRWVADVVLRQCEVWVAEEDGRVVGFAALSDDRLEHLYVRPGHQGGGLGTALLAHAKRRRPQGFDLWTFQRNEGARLFYERHGFEAVEETDGSGNEEREPDVRYEWRP
ncbi:MAG: GNAT family N-acetyltransferase [Thermoleophilia bacterium]|nr:GNAT family N-acetyltransferase [Thermoleophilia bacterium]